MINEKHITVSEFFATDVREYSVYANQRAIPSIIDGLKPSQRKVVFGTLKKTGIPETGIKVSQLSGFISLVSAYHHGESSLEGAIVKLAQDYPGSNNLNYFKPLGQFGSRLSDSSAASRYIFTDLDPVFRKVFKKDDDSILEHLTEDGEIIEPNYYLPILPNVLINGSSGMGTGFATNILQYNPEDLRKYLIDKLKSGSSKIKLTPWFRGFKGKVEKINGQTIISGTFVKESTTKITVTELPIGYYQDDYKQILFKLQDEGIIKDFDNESNINEFKFVLDVPRTTGYLTDEELLVKLKLISKNTENMTVWLPSGKLKCFSSAEEICDEFLKFRLGKYEVRRQTKINELTDKLELLTEKVRFIEFYLEGSRAIEISKLKKIQIEELLKKNDFKHIEQLLDIKIYNLTKDQIDKLMDDVEEVMNQIEYYEGQTDKSLYLKDLNELDLKQDLAPKIKTVKKEKKK